MTTTLPHGSALGRGAKADHEVTGWQSGAHQRRLRQCHGRHLLANGRRETLSLMRGRLLQRFGDKTAHLWLGIGLGACSGNAAPPDPISVGHEPTAAVDSSGTNSGSSTNDVSGTADSGSDAPSTDGVEASLDGGAPSTLPDAPSPDGGGVSTDLPDVTADDTACDTPLELGSTDLSEPHMQLLWTGSDFLVAWRNAEGYSLRGIHLGAVSEASLPNPAPETSLTATMLWVNERLHVYSTQDAVITRQVYDATLNELEPSEQISDGVWPQGFAQVGDEVVFTAYNSLYVEGVQHDVYWGGPSVVGYNGTDLMGAEVLGHGEWRTNAAAGAPNWTRLDPPPIDKRWPGAYYVHGGGASFASSPDNGLHALAITSGPLLWVAVQGYEPWEGQAVGELPEASFIWDGERYALFLADGPANYRGEAEGTALRDLKLHFVSPEGQVDAFEQGIDLSLAEEDDSAPAAVALGAGRYAVAWKRGSSVVFAECQIDGRAVR
jgi:hypothetical protein